jgi:hypothetical protein
MTWEHLKVGGHYCLNVNKDIYENVCVELLGEANEFLPLVKRKRFNEYEEYIYVWIKRENL